jgi:hypothetical protein
MQIVQVDQVQQDFGRGSGFGRRSRRRPRRLHARRRRRVVRVAVPARLDDDVGAVVDQNGNDESHVVLVGRQHRRAGKPQAVISLRVVPLVPNLDRGGKLARVPATVGVQDLAMERLWFGFLLPFLRVVTVVRPAVVVAFVVLVFVLPRGLELEQSVPYVLAPAERICALGVVAWTTMLRMVVVSSTRPPHKSPAVRHGGQDIQRPIQRSCNSCRGKQRRHSNDHSRRPNNNEEESEPRLGGETGRLSDEASH